MHLRNSCERSTSTCCIRYSPGARPAGGAKAGTSRAFVVVERHVGDQVADHREGAQRRDRDGLVLGERGHPGHAQQPRPAVDLRAARAALAGLAVPAHREVRRLGGLQPVDDVEDDLALVDLDRVVLQLAAVGVAAPHPEAARRSSCLLLLASSGGGRVVEHGELLVGEVLRQLARSNSSSRSGRIVGHRLAAAASTARRRSSSRQTRLTWRHCGSIAGKSSRVWPPRLSVRSSAALATHSLTSSMLRRSSARCQPGLNCRWPSTPTRCGPLPQVAQPLQRLAPSRPRGG